MKTTGWDMKVPKKKKRDSCLTRNIKIMCKTYQKHSHKEIAYVWVPLLKHPNVGDAIVSTFCLSHDGMDLMLWVKHHPRERQRSTDFSGV